MICVLVLNKSSVKIPFTVPWVPTGINTGVSIVPLGVIIFPNLALSFWAINSKENSLLDIKYYFDLIEIILSGVGTAPLLGSPFFNMSTNSIPLITFPKAEYCLSKCGAES